MKAEAKQKEYKIRVSGQWFAHARTSPRVHNQARVRRQDYAYVGSCVETLKHKNRAEPQNGNSNNLTCI